MIRISFLTIALVTLYGVAGCKNEAPRTPPKTDSGAAQVDDHDHQHAGGHEDEGPVIELGTAMAGPWNVRVARDAGAIAAGAEPPVDAWITGGSGTIAAVRFWIGTADAAGSIKVLAEVENPADQTHRHAHVEVPKPLPEGSKLWVEVEDNSGAKNAAGFELKM